jgi:hypothetical protein
VPDGKLAPEFRAWEGRTFDREAFLAGPREVEQTGGVELQDFLHELEQTRCQDPDPELFG